MITTPSRRSLARAGLLVPTLILGTGWGANAAGRPTSTPPAHTAPSLAHITITGYAFRPKTLTVVVGTRVTWTNRDSDSHPVASDTGAFVESATLSTGHSFTHTFAKTGVYRYHCGLHAFMTGTVVVKGPVRSPR